MSDLHNHLDREASRIEPTTDALSLTQHRANRQRRNRKVRSATVALLISAAGIGLSYAAFRPPSEGRPLAGPSPTPGGSPGMVAPVPGKHDGLLVEIVYPEWQVGRYFNLLLTTPGDSPVRYDFLAMSLAPERSRVSGIYCDADLREETVRLRDRFLPEAEIHVRNPGLPGNIQIVLGQDFVEDHRGQLHVFDFVHNFMEARTAGKGAEGFLNWHAAEQYERGENGLSLYGYTGDTVDSFDPRRPFDVTGWKQVGEGSFVATVQVNTKGGVPPSETLQIASEILTNPESPDAEVVSAERTQ